MPNYESSPEYRSNRFKGREFVDRHGNVVTDLSNVGGGSYPAENVVDDHGASGDGATDDAEAIQSAIDAADPGGMVIFPDGEYGYGSQMEPKNVTLYAPGDATLTPLTGSGLSIAFFSAAALDDFTVRGLTFDGNRTNETVRQFVLNGTLGGVLFENCRFENIGDVAVDVRGRSGSDSATVRNCTFENVNNCIEFSGDTDVITVEGNRFFNGANRPDDIIQVFDSGIVSGASHERVEILDNRSLADPHRYSIRVADAEDVEVDGNRVSSVAQYYDTQTTGGSADQISITQSGGGSVTDNYVAGSGDVGITIENNTDRFKVANNTVEDCDAFGIVCTVGAGRNIIEGNTVRNCMQNYSGRAFSKEGGIVLVDVEDVIVSANHAYDDQGTKTQTNGISVSGACDYNIITDNNIRGNVNVGVAGTTGSNSIVSGNIT